MPWSKKKWRGLVKERKPAPPKAPETEHTRKTGARLKSIHSRNLIDRNYGSKVLTFRVTDQVTQNASASDRVTN